MKRIFYILIPCLSVMMLFWFFLIHDPSNAKLVKEWQGREIIFPQDAVFTLEGRDTINMSLEGDHKILVYIDSIGCTSCKLQLNKWAEFMQEVQEVKKNNKVKFLFFLANQRPKDIRLLARRFRFVYPMCGDTQNQLNVLNQFPEDELFHVFLLDKDNRVEIIGNPIRNQSVRKLYLEQIAQ